jgi:predicted dehydrogenase
MKKNCAVIGCGKAFQILHMKNIQENYKIISVYDPRPNLLNAISKKLSIKKKFNNIESLLKKTQVKIFFCFLPRDISFSAIKKIIKKKNIILFLEKPPILFIENLLFFIR